MKTGIQYVRGLKDENITNAGFDQVEYSWEDYQMLSSEYVHISGLEVGLEELDAQKLYDAMVAVEKEEASYVLISTVNVKTSAQLEEMIEEVVMAIADFSGEIYIENGMCGTDASGYTYGAFSSAEQLRQICNYGNRIVGREVFKAAINVGYANLLEKNVRSMIDQLKGMIGLVHVSDNDGKLNQRQMPYTFTTGRGARSTDWNKILGALMKQDYQGWIVFDTVGLFQRIPEDLQRPMLELLKEIERNWDKQFRYEELLCQPDKQIILFGAGAMACHYLQKWGEKYPPVFLVDNSSEIWGKNLDGIPIRSPQAILEIPEKDRLVLICNMHYNEIRAQLTGMGVVHEYFNDEFYM